MNCKPIQQQLERGSSLGDAEAKHVESCESCQTVVAKQRAVSRSLQMMAAAEPPIGAADRAFRAAMAGDSLIATPSLLQRLLPIATPFAMGAAAAAAIALLIGAPVPNAELSDSGDEISSGLLSDDADDEFAVTALLALGDDE